ncbi:hypothetical protein [Aneurinibacillus terranovensis]|uniref:hypothetical protein n=1 Tax=Aneurinibacillus terranovensis TaxID=278991 RepID=UPI00040EA1BA|nr:hypothetical protein [Aneurinibacillus terranovensis]
MIAIEREAIEIIVREVLSRVLEKSSEGVKPVLLLLGGRNTTKEDLDRACTQLQAKWRVIEGSAFEQDSLPLLNGTDHVLFLDAGQDLMIRGALGLTDTGESQVLADALLRGISVTMVPCCFLQWLCGKPEASLFEKGSRYRNHIYKHKEQLVSFGVHFVEDIGDLLNIEREEKQEKAAESQLTAEKTVRFAERLLTQRDVQLAEAVGIIVSHTTIITPLARDTARERGITIHVEES